MKAILSLIFSTIFLFSAYAQVENTVSKQLNWKVIEENNPNISINRKLLGYDEANYVPLEGFKPMFIERIETKNGLKPLIELQVVKTRIVNNDESICPYAPFLTNDFENSTFCGYEQGKKVYFFSLAPARKMGSSIEIIEEMLLVITWVADEQENENLARKKSGKINSKMAKGNWHKISVTETGVYKLDKKFFDDNNISLSGIDANKIAVFGYGGKDLPMLNQTERPEDLAEIPSKSVGLSDGSFDDGDYLLFYAQGPITWSVNKKRTVVKHSKNTYAENINYFVEVGEYTRTEISNLPKLSSTANITTNSYDYVFVHHQDKLTDISKNVKTGKEWFGEEFNFNTTQTFDIGNIDGLITSDTVYLKSSTASRCFVSNSAFNVKMNGKNVFDQVFARTGSDYLDSYVTINTSVSNFFVNSSNLSITYEYNKPSSNAVGWLNFFEINARAVLSYTNNALSFRDKRAIGTTESIVQFNIKSSTGNLYLWNVSDINATSTVPFDFANNTISFKAYADKVNEYILFGDNDTKSPSYVEKVSNQNLHGLPYAEVFIIAYDSFVRAANELAAFHKENEGFRVNVVTPTQIYNEFSGGTQDISAIRDFMRYFYENATSENDKPKYLILFGDASYDYMDRIIGNTNLVPSYQSNNSIDPTVSYVSDDYFGLLDPKEGDWETNDPQLLDIAIGRLPVQTSKKAFEMVNKIKAYHDMKSLGDWRNNLVFVADDQDGNLHLSQTEELANFVDTSYSLFNIKKIYLDAYVQEIGPGGAQYPDVEKRLDETVESGVLVLNYMGHGGEQGWAHESVLDNSMINGWNNLHKMPLFITATCEFSRFDDPERTSAGENVFLNAKGGAIAMLTTTRVVYAGANAALLKRLYTDNIFEPIDDRYRTLGEIIMTTKNKYSLTTNTRNFTLLGDPVVRLAYPKYRVATTSINGTPANSAINDTLRALSKVVVTGIVTDLNGNKLTSYNGIVYPTVFDKIDTLRTLANDEDSRKVKFGLRKNIIYKGKATVKNGDFTFEFVVPKDISYKLGFGKISYYTENSSEDGNGEFFNFLIGGTATSVLEDDDAPKAELFVNDLQFSFGGIANEDPIIIGLASDDNGINTVGTGIGHELILTLDDGEPIVVNDYYEAELDDYTSGRITYPFKDLEEGRHSVSLKVWDVANNSSTAYTEFVVANSAQLALEHVVNYPNPFTTNTTFWLNHNRPGDILDVTIQIFSVTGKLVKTLKTSQVSNGSTFNELTWDGRDDYGQNIGKGVYVYKVSVKTSDGLKADAIEKLVILK